MTEHSLDCQQSTCNYFGDATGQDERGSKRGVDTQTRSPLADGAARGGKAAREAAAQAGQALRGSTWLRLSRFCAASRMCSSTAFRAMCGSPVAIASTTCW